MESRVNWILLTNVMLVSFLIGSSHRIFAVSLPTIASHLASDMVGISWALISFQISTISLSLVFGRIGDLYGRGKVYGFGISTFTAGSLLCGLSQDVGQLILFRLLQGIGAAMAQAQGRVLAMEAVPERHVGRAQGLMTTAYHTGFLLGPSIGGLIIDYIHWRGVFFFLVPLGAAGLLLILIQKGRGGVAALQSKSALQSVDYLGAALLVAATAALVAVLDRRLIEMVTAGFRSLATGGLLFLFLAFLLREATASSPILNLSLFKIRMFSFSTLALLIVTVTQSLTVYLLPFYFQEVLRVSPSFMGVLFMATPIFSVALSPVGGSIADKIGPRLPATAGVLFFGAASLIGAFLRTDSSWWQPTLMLALGGPGTAFFFPPNHMAMISSVPREHRGVATGSLYMMFGLGSILGISLANYVMTAAFRLYSGLPGATPSAAHPAAFVAAINATFLTTAAISLVALVVSILRGKGGAS